MKLVFTISAALQHGKCGVGCDSIRQNMGLIGGMSDSRGVLQHYSQPSAMLLYAAHGEGWQYLLAKIEWEGI